LAPAGRSAGPWRSWTPQACARKGGTLTGANPVDRGKPGSKIHVLSDAGGLPLVIGISAANTHDRKAFKPLFMAIPPIRSRRGPRRRRPDKVRADKGYDFDDLWAWLRERGIIPRIARRGIESSERLGRHRYFVALARRLDRAAPKLRGCGAGMTDILPDDQGDLRAGIRRTGGSSDTALQETIQSHPPKPSRARVRIRHLRWTF
jgi:hypothetical protein